MAPIKQIAPLAPLTIIERHADQFVSNHLGHNADSLHYNDPREVIDNLKVRLYDYNKYSEKLMYTDRVRYRIKIGMDNHDAVCQKSKTGRHCHIHEYLEDILYFLQNNIEDLQGMVEPESLSALKRTELENVLEIMRRDLDVLKLSAEFSYNDIMNEIGEIKTLYHLNRKNLSEVLIGKFSEMVAGGVISETVSKGIIDVIRKNYPSIIESLR